MKPVPIPFPLSTAPGVRGQESSGRVINAYAEPLGKGAPSGVVYRRAPGLQNWGTCTASGFRGAIKINSTLFAAYQDKLVYFGSAGGTATNVGTLAGDAKGFFASNNAATPDMVFCDPDGNISTFTSGTVTGSYPDPDLPSVTSCCSIDGYFIFGAANGKMWASGLNTTSVLPTAFATAEFKPDPIYRVINYSNTLIALGSQTTEFWQDVGSTPFPFQRAQAVNFGIAGPYCVAGQEDGFGAGLVIVANDNTVRQLNGYTFDKISPPDLDGLIEDEPDKSLIECSVYLIRGHPFVLVQTSGTASWSWVYDLNTGKWSERNSYLAARSRITGGISAFGKWLCGDTNSGNVLQITKSAYNEVGQPLRWRIESGAVENFPVGMRVGRADFNFVTGVGVSSGTDPIQTDPTVEISWSDDGGQNWYPPQQRKIGRQSQTAGLISLVASTGRSSWNGRRWRLDVADPVYVGFMGGTQNTNPRVSDFG